MATAMDTVRVCGTCGKEFHIGMTAIDNYVFKIKQPRGISPKSKYYCKYSCYKPATEVKIDGRQKKIPKTLKEILYETLY